MGDTTCKEQSRTDARPVKSKTAAILFGIFLGKIGIHDFYLGMWPLGLAHIFAWMVHLVVYLAIIYSNVAVENQGRLLSLGVGVWFIINAVWITFELVIYFKKHNNHDAKLETIPRKDAPIEARPEQSVQIDQPVQPERPAQLSQSVQPTDKKSAKTISKLTIIFGSICAGGFAIFTPICWAAIYGIQNCGNDNCLFNAILLFLALIFVMTALYIFVPVCWGLEIATFIRILVTHDHQTKKRCLLGLALCIVATILAIFLVLLAISMIPEPTPIPSAG